MAVAQCSGLPVNVTDDSCERLKTLDTGISVLLLLTAISVLIILSCVQKRVKLCQNCCGGQCGIAIPLNLLHTTRHRIIYMLIFGTLSDAFFHTITGGIPIKAVSISDPFIQSIVNIIISLVYILLLCLVYYPVFACVDSPVPLVGHILGSIYIAILLCFWCLVYYTSYTGCQSGCQADRTLFAITVLKSAPVLLIEFFLMCWFIGNILYDVLSALSRSTKKKTSETDYILTQYARVKHLLKKKDIETETKLKKLILKIYPYDPGFKFPLRFLAAMIISIVILYQLTLISLYKGINISLCSIAYREQILKFANDVINSSINFPISDHNIYKVAKIISGAFVTTGVLVPVGYAFATLFCAVQIFLTFRNVSDHFHRIAKGDLSFLPKNLPKLKTTMLSSLRYPGYQVAYIVWAWFIYGVVVILLMLAAVLAVYLTIQFHSFFVHKIAVVVIGIAWTQILYWSQFLLVKFLFLEKAYPNSQHLVMNNRRSFHWFSFIMILQNTIVGIFSTVFRVIVALIIGLLFFMRLDKLLLMKGMEYFDFAHKTYIGFLYLDFTHNNSVLNVFCHILLTRNKKLHHQQEIEMGATRSLLGSLTSNKTLKKYVLLDSDDDSEAGSERPIISQRAFNRWKVAYTLIRNEQLIKYTASNLQKSKEVLLTERLGRRAGFCNDVPLEPL